MSDSTDNFLSLIAGQWDEFRVKNAILCLHMFFWQLFYCFSSKNCAFIIFMTFFDEVSNFRSRILTIHKPESIIRNCQWKCMQ